MSSTVSFSYFDSTSLELVVFEDMIVSDVGVTYTSRSVTKNNIGSKSIFTNRFKNVFALSLTFVVPISSHEDMEKVLDKMSVYNSDTVINSSIDFEHVSLRASVMGATYARSGDQLVEAVSVELFIAPLEYSLTETIRLILASVYAGGDNELRRE